MREHGSLSGALLVLLAWRFAGHCLAAPSTPSPSSARSAGPSWIRRAARVSDAAVLVVDESTGVPRAGRAPTRRDAIEASEPSPGTYRIEVVTPNFKKAERTGMVLRAAGSIDLGTSSSSSAARTETVTVSAEAINNITPDSRAIARGLDEQQLHDLPRDSRDIQSFLLLNPNVLGGTDDIQFLGGRTYGVSYIQDGQASTNAIFGTVGNSAPGLDAISEMQVLSNSYSAEYGGLAGVVVTTKRGSNNYRGTAFYDFNSNGLNALTYNQKLGSAACERGRPQLRHPPAPLGGSLGGPLKTGKTFFYANYEGSNDKAIFGGAGPRCPRRPCAAATSAAPPITLKDPAHRPALPQQRDPRQPHRPGRPEDHELLLSAAEPGARSRTDTASSSSSCPRPRTAIAPTSASTTRRRKNDSIFLRGSYQHYDPNAISFEGRQRARPTCPSWTASSTPRRRSRAGRRSSPAPPSTSSASATTTTQLERRARSSTPTSTRSSASRTAPSMPADRRGFPRIHVHGQRRNRPNEHRGRGARRGPHRHPELLLRQRQPRSWIMGGHSLKAGALWNRNIARSTGSAPASTTAAATRSTRRPHRQRVQRLPPRPPARRPDDQAAQPRTPRTATPTTSRSSSRTTGRSAAT